jgi:outer membrane protein OmpA-like peptidoglycan-associated protein
MKTTQLTSLIGLGVSLIAASGCAHKSVKSEPITAPSISDASTTQNLDLAMTHFALNSSVLTAAGKTALKQDALALQSSPQVKIQAQGYCDDRGTVPYNMALGERRAHAVKAYLETLGITADRITTVSFGKSDPLDPRDNQQAWALNRRASFVVQSTSNKVALR